MAREAESSNQKNGASVGQVLERGRWGSWHRRLRSAWLVLLLALLERKLRRRIGAELKIGRRR